MDQLVMFAKYWQAGAVKTRLARTIGDERAAALYLQFLKTLLARLNGVADRCLLAFTPREREQDFAAVLPAGWELTPQLGNDLGERMQHAMRRAFKAGVERVVLIGSDSPDLPVVYLTEAFSRLAEADVVLGPADDGGYYLVGARGEIPPIFEGIAWGSPQVWKQTIERLGSAEQNFAVLPKWYDVDDIAALRRMYRQRGQASQADSRIIELCETLARNAREYGLE